MILRQNDWNMIFSIFNQKNYEKLYFDIKHDSAWKLEFLMTFLGSKSKISRDFTILYFHGSTGTGAGAGL